MAGSDYVRHAPAKQFEQPGCRTHRANVRALQLPAGKEGSVDCGGVFARPGSGAAGALVPGSGETDRPETIGYSKVAVFRDDTGANRSGVEKRRATLSCRRL